MKTKSRSAIRLMAIVSLWVLASSMVMQSTLAADTTVNFQINAGVITYGWPASLTFSSPLNVSFEAQTVNQDFTGATNYFWVQDLKWIDSWYNTTLQLSWDLVAGANSISWSNVLFRSVGSITTVSGSANPRVVLDWATSAYQALNASRSFVRRNAAANFWVIGYYGANINLRIDVPAWQPAGAYAWVLVYTLIEN